MNITHNPPQLFTINGSYTVALPPLSTIAYECHTRIFVHVESNFYAAPPPPFHQLYQNSFATFNDLLEYICIYQYIDIDFLQTFPVNENLSIFSFKQWHDLTKQNPNFMQEQFDPKCRNLEYYTNPGTNRQMAMYYGKEPPRNSTVIAKIRPPSRRSITVDDGYYMDKIQLAFPKLALIQIGKNNRSKLLCLVHTRGNNYVPFQIPNVDGIFGETCMGPQYQNSREKMPDYFWNSSFTLDYKFEFKLNEAFSISSVQQWEQLTQQNPNFFQEQLDPDFLEYYSPVLYQLEPDNKPDSYSLSCTLQ